MRRLNAPGSGLAELVVLMRRLRAECGWKAAQTHRSLARHLLEETHELLEVLDGIPEDDEPATPPGTREHLREELGDVLLQVLFHAAIAEEHGWFDAQDVAAGLSDKLLRRNPHVFGDPSGAVVRETDPERINELWEQAKAAERRPEPGDDAAPDLLAGVPASLPALTRAAKVLDRRERAGLPRPVPPTSGDDLGDRLLGLVALARRDGVDPEQALRDALRRLPS